MTFMRSRAAAALLLVATAAIACESSTEPGTATKLSFTVQPNDATAGEGIAPAVAIQDASGNTVTSATGAVTVALGANPGGGTLSGTTTVNPVNGMATFSGLSINKAGSGYTLVASSTSLMSATSAAFSIAPAAAAKLVFTGQPGSGTADATLTPAVTVAIQDAYGNTVSSATNAVTVALGTNPAGGTLSGSTTVNAVSGVATFSGLSINKAGSGYTLVASAGPLTSATSEAFAIAPAAATKLAFIGQPTNATAGVAITPAVQVAIQDASGNMVTSATGAVTVALSANPGGATLSGTKIANAINGVASFPDLSIDRVGDGYTLGASSGTLTSATSAAFTVTPAAATKLGFTVQPPSLTERAQPMAPAVVVAIQDAFGNTVTSATNPVTLALATNPGGGTLSGTTTVNASAGIATFADLSIDQPGSGYAVVAASGSLTSATSAPFGIRFTFTVVSAGANHACVMTTGGAAYCWGYNSSGQLGDGTMTEKRLSAPRRSAQ